METPRPAGADVAPTTFFAMWTLQSLEDLTQHDAGGSHRIFILTVFEPVARCLLRIAGQQCELLRC